MRPEAVAEGADFCLLSVHRVLSIVCMQGNSTVCSVRDLRPHDQRSVWREAGDVFFVLALRVAG